jgi:hypothetical protein
MTMIELAPCNHTLSPLGVQHLISQNPEEYQTLCGTIVGESWMYVGEVNAVCFACHLELKRREEYVETGDYYSTTGEECPDCGETDRIAEGTECPNCGHIFASSPSY